MRFTFLIFAVFLTFIGTIVYGLIGEIKQSFRLSQAEGPSWFTKMRMMNAWKVKWIPRKRRFAMRVM